MSDRRSRANEHRSSQRDYHCWQKRRGENQSRRERDSDQFYCARASRETDERQRRDWKIKPYLGDVRPQIGDVISIQQICNAAGHCRDKRQPEFDCKQQKKAKDGNKIETQKRDVKSCVTAAKDG